jgi:hypothetical protein
MELFALFVLAPTVFGIPGALMGWLAGRRGGHAPAAVAGILAALGAVIVVGGFATTDDPLGVWAISLLLGVLVINALTAFAGVELARYSQTRDAHLD